MKETQIEDFEDLGLFGDEEPNEELNTFEEFEEVENTPETEEVEESINDQEEPEEQSEAVSEGEEVVQEEEPVEKEEIVVTEVNTEAEPVIEGEVVDETVENVIAEEETKLENKEVETIEEPQKIEEKEIDKTMTLHRFDPEEKVFVTEFKNVRDSSGYTKIENQFRFTPLEGEIERVIITKQNDQKIIQYKLKNKAGSLYDEEDVCRTYEEAEKLCEEKNRG